LKLKKNGWPKKWMAILNDNNEESEEEKDGKN
jgi:hypothetical protein